MEYLKKTIRLIDAIATGFAVVLGIVPDPRIKR
jgi:hypothetical protein